MQGRHARARAAAAGFAGQRNLRLRLHRLRELRRPARSQRGRKIDEPGSRRPARADGAEIAVAVAIVLSLGIVFWSFSIRRVFKLLAIVLLLPLYWIVSEFCYVWSVVPTGVSTVDDYFQNFGPPSYVRVMQRNDKIYYEILGQARGSRQWVGSICVFAALPSGPPAYIFDGNGHLVEWTPDSGDDSQFQRRWPYK